MMRIDSVDCVECGDYGIHLDDNNQRSVCGQARIIANDGPDHYRCTQGHVPWHIIESIDYPPFCYNHLIPLED